MQSTFSEFDPLEAKSSNGSEAATQALKREISNILSSYVGWYDPFCELIQNALDSVDSRESELKKLGQKNEYKKFIHILIDIKNNKLTVTDNGIGLNKDQFQQFLAPSFSFKSGKTRGHKGVGATYVAYGFNYLQIASKCEGFNVIGKILGARSWLLDPAPSGNPKVSPDNAPIADAEFENIDRGVSITVGFDETTHPKKLDWIQTSDATNWFKILSIKTGLGSIQANDDIKIKVSVISNPGKRTEFEKIGTCYHWIHKEGSKSASFKDIIDTEKNLFDRQGASFRHPDKISNLDFVYETWTAPELVEALGKNLDRSELDLLEAHNPLISVEFGYTAKLWQRFNESLSLRSNYRVMNSGIQLAANNMPQGEPIQIPLNRNIGRQNQLHFLIHFENYSPDMGRKGFHRELSDFAKEVSRKITEQLLSKVRARLKSNTGVAPDLLRSQQVSQWKNDMLKHEGEYPLSLTNQNFFLPTKQVSITSIPTREQDVIALFNQLIAGGVIRGIRIMSTNERLTYDGLFRIAFDLETEKYSHNSETNPLGIDANTAEELKGIITEPKILEYKYSLDGLVEDFESGDKNSKDIELAIVWSTGDFYKERYSITSFLVPENISLRQYHGVTHMLCDIESGARVMDLIVLEELIHYLNKHNDCVTHQRIKYE